MGRLILLRHGESQWNLENRFTGWVDVPLSPRGIQEAAPATSFVPSASTVPSHPSCSERMRPFAWHSR